jgi:hypothetical protein
MANIYPIQLNNLKFYVNPRNMKITKNISYGTLPTQSGVQYQIWYNSPEMLVLTGASAGQTAYQELLFLKQQFEKTNKTSSLFYKTRSYQGFITLLDVEASTSHLNEFTYTLNFQLLFGQEFAIEDFSLSTTNNGLVLGAIAHLQNQLNIPLNKANATITNLLNKF